MRDLLEKIRNTLCEIIIQTGLGTSRTDDDEDESSMGKPSPRPSNKIDDRWKIEKLNFYSQIHLITKPNRMDGLLRLSRRSEMHLKVNAMEFIESR